MKIKTMFVMIVLFLLSFSVCVSAAPVDLDATGSISVSITYKDMPVGGGTLTVIRVADVLWENEGYVFSFSDSFETAGLTLEDMNTKETAELYAAYADVHQVEGTTLPVDENGNVTFSQLPVGLYLVTRHVCAYEYAMISPFLVTVPLEVAGETVYDVDASPKVSFDTDLPQGDRPDKPDTPDNPDTPDDPDTPDNPDTPDDPDTPDTPDTPDDPDTPDKPDTPDEPDTPDTPDTPDKPDSPDEDEKIPQTGQLKWPIPVFAVIGLLMVIVGWLLVTGREKVTR